MKRRQTVIVILVICFLYLLGATANTLEVPGDTIVYVTDNGTKYHRDGCSYLESKYAIEKRTAEKQGYEPCSRCAPHLYVGKYEASENSESGNPSSKSGGEHRTARLVPLPKTDADKEDQKYYTLSWDEFWAVVVLVFAFIITPVWYIVGSIREKWKQKRNRAVMVQEKELPERESEPADDTCKGTNQKEDNGLEELKSQMEESVEEPEESGRVPAGDDAIEARAERTEDYWVSLLETVEREERDRVKRKRERNN